MYGPATDVKEKSFVPRLGTDAVMSYGQNIQSCYDGITYAPVRDMCNGIHSPEFWHPILLFSFNEAMSFLASRKIVGVLNREIGIVNLLKIAARRLSLEEM
jgi:hypothetical protein